MRRPWIVPVIVMTGGAFTLGLARYDDPRDRATNGKNVKFEEHVDVHYFGDGNNDLHVYFLQNPDEPRKGRWPGKEGDKIHGSIHIFGKVDGGDPLDETHQFALEKDPDGVSFKMFHCEGNNVICDVSAAIKNGILTCTATGYLKSAQIGVVKKEAFFTAGPQ